MMIRMLCLAAFFVVASLAVAAQAGPACSVVTDSVTPDCSASGWLNTVPGFVCAHRTVTCPTTGGVSFNNNFGITFGYLTPASPLGTIVLFSNSGGTEPAAFPGAETDFAHYYYNKNYQVVETAWDADWEDTGTSTKNVAFAAGRPAAFLQWVRYGSATGGSGLWSTGGMCVHGTSAGSALAAYALSWYGAGSYIDKVEMLSGPTLSDIEAGCSRTEGVPSVQVCPSGQLGCNSANSPSSWTQSPSYTDALSGVRTWTGDTSGDSNSCRPTTGYSSGSANAAWKAESIVDGTVATFSYPHTNITTWVCANVWSSDGLNDGIMNNSSPQAQLFFQNFTSSSQIEGLTINAVTSCNGDEGVAGSNAVPPSNYSGMTGMQAIEFDMLSTTNGCVAHH